MDHGNSVGLQFGQTQWVKIQLGMLPNFLMTRCLDETASLSMKVSADVNGNCCILPPLRLDWDPKLDMRPEWTRNRSVPKIKWSDRTNAENMCMNFDRWSSLSRLVSIKLVSVRSSHGIFPILQRIVAGALGLREDYCSFARQTIIPYPGFPGQIIVPGRLTIIKVPTAAIAESAVLVLLINNDDMNPGIPEDDTYKA